MEIQLQGPGTQLPAPRHPSPLPVVFAAILAAALAGGGVYAWQAGKLRDAIRSVASVEERAAALVRGREAAPKPPPFFYTKGDFPTMELHAVAARTGADTVIYKKEGASFRLYAVPRINYDGRIFLEPITEGDSPTDHPAAFDVKTGNEPTPVSFNSDLPFVGWAQAVSPDETRIAAAYDNPDLDPEGSPQKSVVVWNLLTGERQTIGTVAPNEYLTQEVGGFAGAGEFNLRWTDLNCVDVTVYRDQSDQEKELNKRNGIDESQKIYKAYRTFCVK